MVSRIFDLTHKIFLNTQAHDFDVCEKIIFTNKKEFNFKVSNKSHIAIDRLLQ